jgi:NADP-dependent 3-hydroxy acid dehydrogenase YdfG
LGNSFVKAIAEAGVIPVILVRRTAIVEKRADEIILIGRNALAVTADVMDVAQFYSAKDRLD